MWLSRFGGGTDCFVCCGINVCVCVCVRACVRACARVCVLGQYHYGALVCSKVCIVGALPYTQLADITFR